MYVELETQIETKIKTQIETPIETQIEKQIKKKIETQIETRSTPYPFISRIVFQAENLFANRFIFSKFKPNSFD